jgi:hypothetical protein
MRNKSQHHQQLRQKMTDNVEREPLAALVHQRVKDLSPQFTRAQLASRAGYSAALVLQRIEDGEARLPLDHVGRLATALEVRPALLMRLALEQFLSPELVGTTLQRPEDYMSHNEAAILERIRELSRGTDPALGKREDELLTLAFGEPGDKAPSNA